MVIYAFDFDGTLTRRDSLLEFIRFSRGNLTLLYSLLLFAPLIALMKVGLINNGKLKELFFRFFYHRVSEYYFADICDHFAERRKSILRPTGLKLIAKAVQEGAEVVVLSASVDRWVEAFFRDLGYTTQGEHPQVRIIGTHLETRDGLITGRFATPNCYGAEKVRRLREVYPNRSQYKLIAYGDSRGDKELLQEADEAHYKAFK